MYCVHCGSENSDDAKFCIKCGRPIAGTLAEAAAGAAANTAASAAPAAQTGPAPNSTDEAAAAAPEAASAIATPEAVNPASASEAANMAAAPEAVSPGGAPEAAGPTAAPPEDNPEDGPDIFRAPEYVVAPPDSAEASRHKRRTGLAVGLIIAAGILIMIAVVAAILIMNGQNKKAYNEQLAQAESCLEETDYEAAIEAFWEAIALDETNVAAYTRLCDVYVILGDYNRALEVIDHGMSVVDDTETLEDKQREIQDYLANGNPGNNVIAPDPSADEDALDDGGGSGSDDSFGTGESGGSESDNSAQESGAGAGESGSGAEENDAAGENPFAHGENPWVLTQGGLLLMNDHFIVVEYNFINIYNSKQELEFTYESEELWNIGPAVTDGKRLYFSVNYRDGEAMENTGIVYLMDIEGQSVSEIFRCNGRSINICGMAGSYLYYESATAEEFFSPSVYRLDVADGSEEPLGLDDGFIAGVGTDFLVFSGRHRQTQPVALTLCGLDGTGAVQLTQQCQSCVVRGRTVYYAEASTDEDYPCVLKSYDVDSGETQVLTGKLEILSFKLLENGSGILAMQPGSADGADASSLIKVEFSSGKIQEIYQGSNFSYKELDGDIYMMAGSELLRWQEGVGKESLLTVENGTMNDIIWQDGHYFVYYTNAQGAPEVTLLQ